VTLEVVVTRVSSKRSAIVFAKELKIIHTTYTCPQCERLTKVRNSRSEDGYEFYCKCCRKLYNARVGSFLEVFKLPLRKLLMMLYLYATDILTWKVAERECQIGMELYTKFRARLRDVKGFHMLAHSTQIGGFGHQVQIDETCYGSAKYFTGSMLEMPEVWVTGGVEVASNKCFMKVVENKLAPTINALIINNVLRGTCIVTDMAKCYDQVTKLGMQYTHYSVNHKGKRFKDPRSGACTNRIEGVWMLTKTRTKKERGTKRGTLDAVLEEYLWTHHNKKKEAFSALLDTLHFRYPPQ